MIEPRIDSIINSRFVFVLCVIMRTLAYDDDCLPTVSYEAQNQRCRGKRRRASSCCGVPISPYLRIDGIRRKSFSYDKLPPHPLKLSICKLDGSSFDVEIVRTATVGELKQAVEGIFSHMPKKGPGKISWLFLILSADSVDNKVTLLTVNLSAVMESSTEIRNVCLLVHAYIILRVEFYISADGTAFPKIVARLCTSCPPPYPALAGASCSMSCSFVLRLCFGRSELEQNGQNNGNSDDLESSRHQHCEDRNEDIVSRYESKLALSYWDGGSHTADWGVVQEGNPKAVLSRQDWQMVSLEASEVSSAFAVVTSFNSQRDPLDGSSDWHARH
ncbi:ubiquitin-like superfamily protein [Actinidia rufa]|uniref:Ubiquitin-like superfamily protein n=1 Tax=Actinidia rufa TaxID=165716 RepID=A0A7J0GC06_9ERIC|nr:ubiquitin-like superfamily protein [Actinidia rufa]